MATVTTLSVLLRADSTRLRRDLQASTRIVRREARNINRSINTALRATAIASAAAVAAIGRVAQVTIQYAAATQRQAQANNVATRNFAALSIAVQSLGADTDTLVDVIGTLQERLQDAREGTATYTEALGRIGLSYKDLIDLSPDEAFIRTVGALRNLEDQAAKTLSVKDLFGDELFEKAGSLINSEGPALVDLFRRIQNIVPPLTDDLGNFASTLLTDVRIGIEAARSGLAVGFISGLRELSGELNQAGIDNLLRGIGEAAEVAGQSLVRFGEFLFDNRVQLARIAEAILYYKVATTAVFAGAALVTVLQGIGALTKALAGIAVTANAIVIVPALIAAALAAAVVALRHTSVDWDTVLDRMLISQRQFILQSRQLWEALSGFAADLFERLARPAETIGDFLAPTIAGIERDAATTLLAARSAQAGARLRTSLQTDAVTFDSEGLLASINSGITSLIPDSLRRVYGGIEDMIAEIRGGVPISSLPDAPRGAGVAGGSLSLIDLSTLPQMREVMPGQFEMIGQAVVQDLQNSLAGALASGDFSSVGDALLQSLTAAFAKSFTDQLFGAVLGGLGLPGFAFGGEVPGPRNRRQLAIVHGGERIFNDSQFSGIESRLGGGQVVINQRLTGDVTEATRRAMRTQGRELADIVQAQFYERRVAA